MEVFKENFENSFFTPKNAFFVIWDFEFMASLDKTLVHHPDRRKRRREIKIVRPLPRVIPYVRSLEKNL